MELISPEEEQRLFEKLLEYYKRLYPDLEFRTDERILSVREIGDVWYTHPGVEDAATFTEKVIKVKKALNKGYGTPVIILKKSDKEILLDGHRRLRAAWELGVPWHALFIVPSKDKEFGVERLIEGRIRDVWATAREL